MTIHLRPHLYLGIGLLLLTLYCTITKATFIGQSWNTWFVGGVFAFFLNHALGTIIKFKVPNPMHKETP